MNAEDLHREELVLLARAVLDDPTLALIMKTKLVRKAPSVVFKDVPEIAALLTTGRYHELTHGMTSNTTLPAEAAIAADIAVGNSVGATAALEAALVGRRAILVNSLGYATVHDEIFRQANTVYSSMGAALSAIRDFRSGQPSQSALGDWSPILPVFDPYRDGEAAERIAGVLRSLLPNDGVPQVSAIDR